MKLIYTILMAFTPIVVSAQILITEIMYNPPEAGQDSLEYLELYNNTDQAILLSGWSFPEGINHTFGNEVIASGEYIIICVNRAAYLSVFGGGSTQVIQWTSGALNNNGEAVSLADPQGNVIFRVVYSNGPGGWYREADGNGASIELCDYSGDPNTPLRWRPSENATGIIINNREIFATPGAENSVDCSDTADYEIIVGDFFFNPADITIEIGQSVKWINTGGIHNINGNQNVFPSNPQSFGNGAPAGGNWNYLHTFTIPGLYRYICDLHPNTMRGSILVRSAADPYPEYQIHQINSVNADGVADSTDVKCSIRGILHGINIRETGLQITLIDHRGDGIGLFTPTNLPGISVQEGDSVRAWGTIGQFRGLLQLNLDGLEVLSRNNPLTDPIIVSELNEFSENKLVQLKNVEIINPAEWTNNPAGFNVTLRDEDGQTFTMRIARNVDIDPTGLFNLKWLTITGIGGQFSSNVNPPWLDGYQILPRYQDDIQLSSHTQNYGNMQISFDLYPNPFQDWITLESKEHLDLIEIYSSSGKLVGQYRSIGQIYNLNLSELPAGLYLIQVRSKQFSQTSKLIKN